jgi:hypothetical protein
MGLQDQGRCDEQKQKQKKVRPEEPGHRDQRGIGIASLCFYKTDLSYE